MQQAVSEKKGVRNSILFAPSHLMPFCCRFILTSFLHEEQTNGFGLSIWGRWTLFVRINVSYSATWIKVEVSWVSGAVNIWTIGKLNVPKHFLILVNDRDLFMQKNNILIQGDRNKDSVYEFTIRNCLKKLSCNFIVTSCRRVLALMYTNMTQTMHKLVVSIEFCYCARKQRYVILWSKAQGKGPNCVKIFFTAW